MWKFGHFPVNMRRKQIMDGQVQNIILCTVAYILLYSMHSEIIMQTQFILFHLYLLKDKKKHFFEFSSFCFLIDFFSVVLVESPPVINYLSLNEHHIFRCQQTRNNIHFLIYFGIALTRTNSSLSPLLEDCLF